MKTMIELYDERPIENVLASEVFLPERTVFLCSPQIARDKRRQEKLRAYFAHRGMNIELVFHETNMYDSDKIAAQLRLVTEAYPDCTLDVTGGTDAALFACGQFCAGRSIPTITYSRRRNAFFDIHKSGIREQLSCTIRHSVADCIRMAGGELHTGRFRNETLQDALPLIEPFFKVFLRHRTQWIRAVTYIQRVSQGAKDAPVSLQVEAPYTVKGVHGSRIDAPAQLLKDLEAIGLLRQVSVSREEVRFAFRDCRIRTWLRDVGSVLELYVYKSCLDTGLFQDVCLSAVVDWEGGSNRDNVTNEIDVIAMKGIVPAFLSCKVCQVETDALNELAILRSRFGGDAAKAAIVTTQNCRSITRHRAAELNIDVIDLSDLKAGRIAEHLCAMMRMS